MPKKKENVAMVSSPTSTQMDAKINYPSRSLELINQEPLYRCVVGKLESHHNEYKLLFPAEMWEEAKKVCLELASSQYPETIIPSLFTKVAEKYRGRKRDGDSVRTFNDDDREDAAREVFWCAKMMLFCSSLAKSNNILPKISQNLYLGVHDNVEYNKFHSRASYEKGYDPDFYTKDAPTPLDQLSKTLRRDNGMQMKVVVVMMNKLWSKLRLKDMSSAGKASFLSAITGWDYDSLYNLLTDSQLESKLSEKQHGADVERANELLRKHFGVMRKIKV